jgi:hypothetical protein
MAAAAAGEVAGLFFFDTEVADLARRGEELGAACSDRRRVWRTRLGCDD